MQTPPYLADFAFLNIVVYTLGTLDYYLIMTTKTKFIGMKELRQNMAKISKEAERKNQQLIVMRKNRPIFKLVPLDDEGVYKEAFVRELEEAVQEVKKGSTYTQKEVEEMLGL